MHIKYINQEMRYLKFYSISSIIDIKKKMLDRTTLKKIFITKTIHLRDIY